MMPRPQKATRRSLASISATSRCLYPQPVPGIEAAGRLGRQLVPVQQVPTSRARLAAVSARRRVPAPLCDQREAHRLERLELAGHAVAAALFAGAARAASERVLDRAQRELELE